MLTVCIQAGGESSRMGEDKALKTFLGRPLIQRVVERLSPVADEVIVTTFTAGLQQTLPIWIYSQMLRPRNRPVTNVTAMLVVLLTTIPILIAQRLTAESSDTEGGKK